MPRIQALPDVGHASDVAGAVSYLISDDAQWVTGALLDVDGGFSRGISKRVLSVRSTVRRATFASDQMSETSNIPKLLEQIPYLREVPIVGILRGYDTPAAVEAARVVADRGIRVLEVTIGSDNVFETIDTLSNFDELVVGVGTVTRASQVAEAASAGAAFVVTPIYDRETVQASLDQGLPILCGAATPTEIHSALAAGATAAKVFPAGQLGGPEYLRAVLAPLGGTPLVPTGGVDPSNAADYVDAGAVALGAGGNLFPTRIAREKDWRALDELAQGWLESLR